MLFDRYFRCGGLLLAAAILLSACTTFQTGKTKLQTVKTVAVISVIGDQFSFTRAGLNSQADTTQYFPINRWNIDETIARETAAAIGTRFQVEPVSYDRAAFLASPRKDSPVKPLNMLRKDHWKELLKAIAPAGTIDAYVVIAKAESTIGSSDRTVSGIGGLSVRAMAGRYYQLHTLYEIKVFDGRSYELIESRSAAPLNNTDMVRLAGPSRLVDESYMPNNGNPAENEQLRAKINDMILGSLVPTLRNLYLADDIR